MCPFGFSVVSYLLIDVESGMLNLADEFGPTTITGAITVEDIKRWLSSMKGECARSDTAQRMALALATSSNAVLGRRKHPRSIEETIKDAVQYEEGLWINYVEREMLKGQPTREEEKKFIERGAQVRHMAKHLQRFLEVPTPRPPPLASTIVHTEAAEKFGSVFFEFAQQECARKGHGLPGLVRSVGIVIGQVSLEEVVFG